jgi:hypothetical protein
MTAAVITPVTDTGNPIYAPTFVYTAEDGVYKGYKYELVAGAQNIFDELVAAPIYLQAGEAIVKDANWGDYGEMSVVDKDDVLGLFATYGLIKGVDVLELKKHARTIYMMPGDSESKLDFESARYVPAGLYLRSVYVSTGSAAPKMIVRYKWYEV